MESEARRRTIPYAQGVLLSQRIREAECLDGKMGRCYLLVRRSAGAVARDRFGRNTYQVD